MLNRRYRFLLPLSPQRNRSTVEREPNVDKNLQTPAKSPFINENQSLRMVTSRQQKVILSTENKTSSITGVKSLEVYRTTKIHHSKLERRYDHNLSCLQVQLPQGHNKHPIPYPQQKTRFHQADRPSLVASPGYQSSYTFGFRGSYGLPSELSVR
jgi:hypothetical protein